MKPDFYAKQLYPRDKNAQEIAKLAFKAGLTEASEKGYCGITQCGDNEGMSDCGHVYEPKTFFKYCPVCGRLSK